MQRLYGRKISDLGFSDFVRILEYKAKMLGSKIIKVDRFYASSQLCSNCGYKNSLLKDLKIRSWQCPACGVVHDRDRNAALNILAEGERIFASL